MTTLRDNEKRSTQVSMADWRRSGERVSQHSGVEGQKPQLLRRLQKTGLGAAGSNAPKKSLHRLCRLSTKKYLYVTYVLAMC